MIGKTALINRKYRYEKMARDEKVFQKDGSALPIR